MATNSKGDIFVYTRTGHPTISIGTSRPFAHGGSRLFQFDKTGKFMREIGQDSYGFLVAQQVRVDPQDNIWIVDQMSSMVIKFDPNGRVQLLLGRKSESERVPRRRPPATLPGRSGALAGRGGRGGSRARVSRAISFSGPPTWRGMPPATSMWPMATATARVAKFDKNGKFIKSWGSRGTEQRPVQHRPRDRGRCAGQRLRRRCREQANSGLRRRRELQDADRGHRNSVGDLHHAGSASSISTAPTPIRPTISTPSGEIYKLELDGKIVGKFGKAGKLPKEFGTVNAIDCRRDNELYVGEIGNWRVQKLTLHPN